MPYIILLVLVIAIVVVAVRKQKFNQQQGNSVNNKSEDIYVTAEEVKEENSTDTPMGE